MPGRLLSSGFSRSALAFARTPKELTPMVGIVLVSHSRPLAEAVMALVRSMAGSALPIAVAAGAGDDRTGFGTDAAEIAEAIALVMDDAGVLVLTDIGSG